MSAQQLVRYIIDIIRYIKHITLRMHFNEGMFHLLRFRCVLAKRLLWHVCVSVISLQLTYAYTADYI